ncbi:type II secretion system F family protein [Candidatus Woesearchaeota archaeon]|nr:type II secretion system F family protein [Candidatus Woesearchaeota archaeon]
MPIIDFANIIIRIAPSVKTNLRIAHNRTPPTKFVQKSMKLALYTSVTVSAVIFFLLARTVSIVKLIPIMLLVAATSYALMFIFILQSPKAEIRKRQREIDREVLFAGRYLLIKLESGTPLVNTIEDASKGFGISAKYFKEIIDDIDTGMPLEKALEDARSFNASKKFKRILWQLVTVLKTGSEVTDVLRATLRSIATEQILEIKRYSKKLNSLMLFYMVLGSVVPSLGLTMLIIMSGFLNLQLENTLLFSLLFLLTVIQLAFLIMVRAARPLVDI